MKIDVSVSRVRIERKVDAKKRAAYDAMLAADLTPSPDLAACVIDQETVEHVGGGEVDLSVANQWQKCSVKTGNDQRYDIAFIVTDTRLEANEKHRERHGRQAKLYQSVHDFELYLRSFVVTKGEPMELAADKAKELYAFIDREY